MGKSIIGDWEEYRSTARMAAAEGCILLENKEGGLPFKKGDRISVFGRMQNHYYKSGTGSGGMVNVDEVISIVDGLRMHDEITLNEQLMELYQEFEKGHPIKEGMGWGNDPWSQEEMPLTKEVANQAAAHSDVALVIIARTAGEDSDQAKKPGSYLLTDVEEAMLANVRKAFSRMVVILNVAGLIDFHFIDRYDPEAVMIVWQGGQMGGAGAADALLGSVPMSGHLTDTVAYEIEDYSSNPYFGDRVRNYYSEGIYVGYRYFETFKQDRVRYPFGYGLDYTTFSEEIPSVKTDENQEITIHTKVTNTGDEAGRYVSMAFVAAPSGKLGKPARVLVAFAKTPLLQPGDCCELTLCGAARSYASYDEAGVYGLGGAFLLEAGSYEIYVGRDVRAAKLAGTFELTQIYVCEAGLGETLRPVEAFDVMQEQQGKPTMVPAVCGEALEEVHRLEAMPKLLKKNTQLDTKLTLPMVAAGQCSIEDLVADLTEEELFCIVRGEGMGSAKVTPGTASAFAGISKSLNQDRKIPAVCCDDGPSGMRLDSGVHAFSLPIGTMLASTFDLALVERLYTFTSIEMTGNHVDVLLGPGMNIHRHPLNGRNFEYFSEDPLLSGEMGLAIAKGLASKGNFACIKHFCGNNQETNRNYIDSVISERTLREIYLRPFELVVRAGVPCAIMTTYGSLNGLWTAGSYDLNTRLLRDQWGFEGIVMTDWWANINRRGKEPTRNDFAAMVAAQNDLYMVCRDASINSADDNLESSLADGSLMRQELERCACNILTFALKSQAYKELMGDGDQVSWINKPKALDDVDISGLVKVSKNPNEDLVLDLTTQESVKGTNYLYLPDLGQTGRFNITVTGSSMLSDLAQIPVSFYGNGIPLFTVAFNGTGGLEASISRDVRIFNPTPIMRLYVGGDGLKLTSLRIHFVGSMDDFSFDQ